MTSVLVTVDTGEVRKGSCAHRGLLVAGVAELEHQEIAREPVATGQAELSDWHLP